VPLHVLSRLVLTPGDISATDVTVSDIRAILMIFDARATKARWSQIKSRLGLTSIQGDAMIGRLRGLHFYDASTAQSVSFECHPIFKDIVISPASPGVPTTAQFTPATEFSRWLFDKSINAHVTILDSDIDNLRIDALAIYLRWAALQHIRHSKMTGTWAPFIGWRYRDLSRADVYTGLGIDRLWIDTGFLMRPTIRYVSVQIEKISRTTKMPVVASQTTPRKWSPAKIATAFLKAKSDFLEIGIKFDAIRDLQKPDKWTIKLKDSEKFRFEERLFFNQKRVSLAGKRDGELADADYNVRVLLGQERRSIEEKAAQASLGVDEVRDADEDILVENLRSNPASAEQLLDGVSFDPALIRKQVMAHEAEVARKAHEKTIADRLARGLDAQGRPRKAMPTSIV
jgi:hypothetical protein